MPLNSADGSQMDLILPTELYDLVWSQIDDKVCSIQYSRVIMPLSALLEEDFFNMYIKTGSSKQYTACAAANISQLTVAGSIAMLSENHPGNETMYILKNGS